MRFPELNEVFEERYEIVEVLGEGAYARVYKAWDSGTQRHVALKILSPKGGAYSQVTGARFLREARIIASLQNPHTITMYDFGETASGLMYMACEYLAGRDLHLELMKSGALRANVVAHVLDQLLQSLREAHGVGVFHRDIKPANILLTEYQGDRYRATLVDFGLAKPIDEGSNQLTQPGKTAGTPRYMAPEQVFGEEMGPATDLYSLGLVAHEMWTGRPAIPGDNQRELLVAQIDGPRTSLPAHLEPASLRRIIDKMTERELEDRYANADEVLRDLLELKREHRRGSSSDVVAIEKPTVKVGKVMAPPEPTSSSKRINPALAAGLGALTLACVVAFAVIQDEPSPPAASVHQLPEELTQVPKAAALPNAPTPEPEPAAAPEEPVEPARDCTALPTGAQLFDTRHGPLRMYSPEGLTKDTARAVLVLFHAGGDAMTNGEFMTYTGLDKIADEHNLLLLSPPHKGSEPRLLSYLTWDDASTDQAWASVDAALNTLCMDELPLALVGEFKGAQAVDYVQCRVPEVRAVVTSAHRYKARDAFGGIRKLPRPCMPEKPVPTLEFFHTGNVVRPYDGEPTSCSDADDDWLSVREHQARSRTRQRCSSNKSNVEEIHGARCDTWSCEGSYTACTIEGSPAWADRRDMRRKPECWPEPSGFPHAQVTWDFLSKYL